MCQETNCLSLYLHKRFCLPSWVTRDASTARTPCNRVACACPIINMHTNILLTPCRAALPAAGRLSIDQFRRHAQCHEPAGDKERGEDRQSRSGGMERVHEPSDQVG